jgi:uncharacterized protein YukE
MRQSSRYSNARRVRLLAFVITTVVVLTGSGYCQSDSQSLGDLARKQRQKQQQVKGTSAASKKVVTNEEIPEHPEELSSDADSIPAGSVRGDSSATPPAADVMKSGEQWKSAIQQQKNAVADLKSHIDKVQDSIHFVEANRYRNGVEYNKVQAEKQKEVQRLQGQLDELQKNLEHMQESARKAGFGSSVWDP